MQHQDNGPFKHPNLALRFMLLMGSLRLRFHFIRFCVHYIYLPCGGCLLYQLNKLTLPFWGNNLLRYKYICEIKSLEHVKKSLQLR